MRILLLGSGGRENALAWKLSQSVWTNPLFIAPGNPGTADAVRGNGGEIATGEQDAARIVRKRRREQIEHGRLARAVGADQAERLAGLYGER